MMNKQLKMLTGVAVFAALVLAGALGAFVLGAAQPVQAQATTPSATRSFSPMAVAPGGTVQVTIAHANTGGIGRVTEMIPSGFIYVTSSLPAANVNTDNASAPTFSLFGVPASFTYDVTAPMTAGDHTFSGTLRSGGPAGHLHRRRLHHGHRRDGRRRAAADAQRRLLGDGAAHRPRRGYPDHHQV